MLLLGALLLIQQTKKPEVPKAPQAQASPWGEGNDEPVIPPPLEMPPVVYPIGRAAWSATTAESASTRANKAWLRTGRIVTLTGEVVDLSCYLQLGKRGDAHKECSAQCVAAGEPVGLLMKDGKVYMLLAEQHHPRRDGQVSLAKQMSGQVGRTVTISGMLMKNGGIPTVFIEAPAK